MASSVPTPPALSASDRRDSRWPVTKITAPLFFAAAQRLVGQTNPDIEAAAKRLVAASGKHGIDLSLVWATIEYRTHKHRASVRQACLAVLGAGRTAMTFLSEPPPSGDPGGGTAALAERGACVQAACDYLRSGKSGDVRIVQALPDPSEAWCVEAYRAAGFQEVGSLTYMRRPGGGDFRAAASAVDWPPGVQIRNFADLQAEDAAGAEAALACALDRSYELTHDCPELCGLRETSDVIASHKSVGTFDARCWWILFLHGKPHGCLLLSPCPEQRSIELVYIGLSVDLRGKGLSRRLLVFGLHHASVGRMSWEVSCAVDDRNAAAIALYGRMGFRGGARRVAMVRPIPRTAEPATKIT